MSAQMDQAPEHVVVEAPILEISGVNVHFNTQSGDLHILRDVSLEVGRGSFVCIVGESGCGKSVTAQSIVQLLPDNGQITSGDIVFRPHGGHLRLNGLEKYGRQMRSVRGGQIGMIFQDTQSSLNPAHRVGRQVAENLLQHTKTSKPEARKKVIEMFGRLGIPDPQRRYDAYPHEFSGGMRQRVMIAMAMICNPELVIADEPTTALDVTIQAQIMYLLKDLQLIEHKTFILITHNMALVSQFADHVAVMYMGRIVEYGTTEQVLKEPRHPYTQALLRSVPSVGMDPSVELRTIDGQTPSPADVTTGCEFAGRCPFVQEQCHLGVIEMRPADDGHPVRCVRVEPADTGRIRDEVTA